MGHAIVLGAGGAAAWPLHLGVVRGLAEMGLPVAEAELVVGTSAGAAVAAAALSDAPLSDLLDEVLTPPSESDRAEVMAEVRDRARRRSWLPAAPHLAREALPGGAGVGVAFAGLAPAGAFPSHTLGRFPGLDRHERWPLTLRIPAVRLSDGATVVFGRDLVPPTVTDAVVASSAVPLLFTPHELDGEQYVDGAAASSTHADLVLDGGADPAGDVTRAIVVAPMTRPGGGLTRRLARARLAEELRRVEATGVQVDVLAPGPDLEADLSAFPRRDASSGRRIEQAGYALVVDALRAGERAA